ncbi:unnamed protein product [Durusdinium trenchii]|uniref:Pentatricopeptide repeat-containing protein, chloroplastic n=1 Tax=Durusdinium trenchii TaxID=1381693 RepID=A0ABP0K5U9_9DINO
MQRTGPAPNVVTYNSLISACGKGQQWLHAIHLLAEARQAKLRPGIVALNSATTACEKGRQWQHAEQLLRNGEAAGLKLDIIGFSAATSACEKGWEWNRAVGLLQEIRQRQLLEVVSCNAALSACGQCSQTRAALAIFRSMRKESIYPSQVSYNAAMSACSAGGRDKEALELLAEMHHTRFSPDLTTYNCAATACGRASMRLGSALTLIEEAEQSRLKPDVLSFLALVPALGCSAEPNLRLAFALDQAEAILGDKPPDLPNALGLSLALAEALASEERLHGGSLQQLHKSRYKLAYQKLHCLTSSWPSPAERLQDPVLEKQNSLGAFFTAASLTDLWLGPTKQSVPLSYENQLP